MSKRGSNRAINLGGKDWESHLPEYRSKKEWEKLKKERRKRRLKARKARAKGNKQVVGKKPL